MRGLMVAATLIALAGGCGGDHQPDAGDGGPTDAGTLGDGGCAQALCGGICCPVEETCRYGACCPAALICGASCCAPGATCMDDGCCPPERLCTTVCCSPGDLCVLDQRQCLPACDPTLDGGCGDAGVCFPLSGAMNAHTGYCGVPCARDHESCANGLPCCNWLQSSCTAASLCEPCAQVGGDCRLGQPCCDPTASCNGTTCG